MTAVDKLNLSVRPGELFGLLGPNGAGKSTLVKMLVGLIKPTSGWAQVVGFPAGHLSANRRIGYLPELFQFPGWMTGAELLDLHGRLLDLPGAERRRRAKNTLEITGLTKAADRKISGYSKGMQQRIGLAQAILGQPDLLFLDEPTSALDPVGRAHVRDLLKTVSAEGTAVFLNSHLLTDVERICDRVAFVSRGRVVKEGSPVGESPGISLFVRLLEIENGVVAALTKSFGQARVDHGRPELTIELRDREQIPAVAEYLTRRGHKIYELREINRSLEDEFLEVIRESEE